ASSPVWATCGGGGGGGVGGMSGGGGGGTKAVVYTVPWKPHKPQDPPSQGLVLYWFPASENEWKNSSLRDSRTLSLYSTQCVAMEVGTSETANAGKIIGDSKLPVAVLAEPDGTPLSKVENKAGKLKVGDVEKIVDAEVKHREAGLDTNLKDAKAKAAAGDKAGAITLYQSVAAAKCMFPKKAKEAAKELKKLGVNDVASIPDAPIFAPLQSAQIEATMRRGLMAELNAHYVLAEKLYSQAHRMDPADPTPLRYLGE